MSGFVKVYEEILDSSIWEEDLATRIVFLALMVRAKPPFGVAPVSVCAVARLANVTKEQAAHALERLSSPDPHSKSKEHEGRRIEVVDGGIKVLNFERYRAGRPDSSGAERQRRYRERKLNEVSAEESDVTERHVTSPASASASASDSASDSEKKQKRKRPSVPIPDSWAPEAKHQDNESILREAYMFRNHALANDRRCVDWNRAFDNWLVKAKGFASKQPPTAPNWAVARAIRMREEGVGHEPASIL